MTDAERTPSHVEQSDTFAAPVGERVQFALRQAGLIAIALIFAGLVTERLRPDTIVDRGFATTIFWWAVVVWFAVLLLNAVMFDNSQIRVLEGPPLGAACAVGGITLLLGLIRVDSGSFVYLLATAIGTVMFWWGLLGLVLLLVRRVADQHT